MADKRSDEIKLGVFYWPGGHHVAGWRHPDGETDSAFNYQRCVELAKTAQRGKFDLFFLADLVGIRPENLDAQAGAARAVYFEPLTLLAALAAVTDRIGLVATATTTYNEPYHLARKFASLDLISGGRVGWNLVTSHNQAEAANFSANPHMAHADRYVRATEFAEVVKGLWDSWEDDAIEANKETGRYFDPAKMHFLNHNGPLFSVKGPLNVPRSPQGQPVIVQAGSSGPGRDLAAQTAEVIFTAAESLAEGQAFYADAKGRLAAHGRSPDDLVIMPGIFPVIGRTEAEAKEKYEYLQSLVQPSVGMFLLQHLLGRDLSAYPLDEPLPDLADHDGAKGRTEVILRMARKDNLTLRQLYLNVAVARGHNVVIGSPSQVADVMEAWFDGRAADGFNVLPPVFPTGLNEFVDLVVPELQRRGRFRTEYSGATLREHLGLRKPAFKAPDAR
ncbi:MULTISPECIES: LLM class flavin-dependent oxidoreductase [unclassified Chelatococcus]|uniref:LLM class flavin-dependent oxidoreductase n=1 Tax=unclassified Chelatococcus TaxID=2638111 RepID=UPI001BCF4159|nr:MULTISPECIES: LLM class flavin-dependent oxidoreductase [unclassified Chelatococcus]CAH1654810.1 N-acetyl-S-(2-succino)cysteine monooxygenase [Hyphomicrobiales bacterium]MBS7742739.1 LLM class flavin-dependent oxidoreductase [Chelatococcus sp. HY11]MBX3542143.1 LLM class flavin-dependent oxidoreductase [Chelatococcus sp.]MCO5075642.1 LLM class flavin-dependent oxidoreductase [Chelatococcus sp.]CAH1695079.1 N-acetyl-S-(2-succino)cysteine monooxygenase [Hyphomicrobiales bacterium]